MKTKFCLRTRGSFEMSPLPVCLIFLVVLVGYAIYATRHLLIFLTILLPLIILILIGMFLARKMSKERFCIDGSNVYVDGWCSYKIDPQEIKGIKIMQMYTSIDGMYHPWRYKNGNPIYLMILLRKVTPEMYNYKSNEYLFKRFLGEYIIAEAEYDPEAVKYLKTLNPDIKVFY